MEGGGGGGGGGGSGGGGGGGGSSGRVAPSFVTVGGRQRFEVELRPGETTIVSWKKLVKDATKANGGPPAAAPPPPTNAHPALESRIAPGQVAENDAKDAPPTSRFSAVIEKIERLYMGKHSSDEEDLNDVPDDDEYDTEDSFIDDTELDDYFQVDNSAIKHDGFFVNRGKLERVEPTLAPNQQPRKRRRKELVKGHSGSDDVLGPAQHAKVGKKAAAKLLPLDGKSSPGPSHNVALQNVQSVDVKIQNQGNSYEVHSRKKSAEAKLDPSPSRVPNADAPVEQKDVDKQRAGIVPLKNSNKFKEGGEILDATDQRIHDRGAQVKHQAGKLASNVDEFGNPVERREKNGTREWPDINIVEGKNTMQSTKVPVVQRKEGSGVRPKSSMLEKAIRELENVVAESRPPLGEAPDADTSSQAVKRRLPPEIKQRLAKVARLAQASHGKISKELISRLMSIVGHLIQLRTLKRNLKIMVNMGLSAKQEKDDRFQQIKREVVEMIKLRVPLMKSKTLEQQAGGSDDFLQTSENKDALKRRSSMDDALEDKICDLYDLYVDGLDEDAGPQVRKLYAELADLWPSGFMDNHGIKRAICRAKDRRRTLYSRQKDQEKIKRKTMLAPKTETVRLEASSIVQAQSVPDKLVSDLSPYGLTSSNRPSSNLPVANSAIRMSSTSLNGPNADRPNQEKVKGSSGSQNDLRSADIFVKKKLKRKPESELGEAHFRPDKLSSLQGEERHVPSHRQVVVALQKPNIQSAGPPSSFEQPN